MRRKSPVTVTIPVAMRFVVVKPECGSMLSFVVYNLLANVSDISFRRGGVASIVYSLWSKAANWNDEIGFNISAVLSTLARRTEV